MRAVSALFVATIALSAGVPHSTFRYELFRSFRREGDTCHICYGDECTTMDESRCQYFVEVDEIIEKPSSMEGQVTEVDAMFYDLTEQADRSWTVQKCIPLISEYTDCTKDNICVGCKSCSCSLAGRWSCSNLQRCRPQPELEVDHRMLVMVMEKLNELRNEEKVNRQKRTVASNINIKPEVKPMTYSEVAAWMYGVKPNNTEDWRFLQGKVNVSTTAASTQTESYSTQDILKSTKSTNAEYLDFSEVLRNIAIEDQSYKRRKSQLKIDNDTAIDINYYKINNGSSADRFIQVLNALEDVTDEKIEDSTFVVDLFPKTLKENNYGMNDVGDEFEISNIINKNDNTRNNNTLDFDMSDEKIELNAINVMKRDVSSVTGKTSTTHDIQTSSQASESSTDSKDIFLENVLTPLTNIIDDKMHEVKELMQIRERLISFIKTHNTEKNFTKDNDVLNGSNINVSIYQLDLFPEIQQDLRRINPNVLDKLLYKLKRDIYEVLKDIARIQTLSKTYGLPHDMQLLIRSMQRFILTQIEHNTFGNKIHKQENQKNTRRLMPPMIPDHKNTANHRSINDQLLDILEVVDRNKPKSNALILLSKSTKKLVKRVINQNYVDEFYHAGLRVYDNEYNLTNDLKTIGKSWPHLTANIANSSPHEKLYAMKLLHFALVEDINKITDAISMVDFAHSRRMMPIGVRTAETVMDRITEGLNSLKNKILLLIKYHTATNQSPLKENMNTNSGKKESFFKKIRNLLRHSKLDVFNMIKKKNSNSATVNTFPDRQLNEVKEPNYEKTMLKWQKYLSMARRKKRELKSHVRSMKNMIKSIIPKYLQGKINPEIYKNHKREKSKVI